MPLQWGNSNARSNTLAGQFPQFQINAADVRRGAVIVNAMSPSGKTHRMTVEDKNGVYTANFTPTEVGDWNVAILYDGQHIQGSPFDVRVYDASRVRVLDLRGGAVGKKFAFTVKADGAGDGKLDVNIVHNGVTVPASIIPTNPALQEYEVDFTPPGSGMYTIRVFFAGMEVPNSPFKLEIIDSSSVTASGRGLTSAAINTNAEFLISTGTISKDGDLRVEISAPSGAKIANQVVDNNNGTFTVRYVASEIGEYIIDVYFYGKPIKGSPFRVQAYDLSSIHVTIPSNGMVDRLVEFDINAARAGSGNLEIMVNDGKIPCSVQNRGNRQFHASFMPRAPGTHYVMMKFNGQPLYNSPWRVDIRSAATMTAGGSGLQMVPVGVRANFEVKTGGIDHGDIRIAITAPSGRLVPSTIKNLGRGDYNVEYMPMEVGNHLVDVTYDNMALPGSPFTSKAYDVNAIVIQPIAGGSVGNHVEFTVDVTQAGEGQLEIMVDGGTIPNHVSMIRKGVFKVDFVPKEARAHKVDIRFNGMNAPSSPFMVPVMDSNRITAIGDGLRHSSVNKQAYFRVNTAAAGAADLAVKVTSPNGQLVPAQIVQQTDGDYKVEYSSRFTGRHTVEILYNNQAIMGSPFFVEIYDPNKVVVTGRPEGTVGVPMSIDIITREAGKANLALKIASPTGRNVPYNINKMADGSGEVVEYVPMEPGPHQIYITYGDLDVAGTPITQNISDTPSSVSASGSGLHSALKGQRAAFSIDTKGRRGNLEVHVKGTHTIAQVQLDPDGNQFKASYVPVEAGPFYVTILWNGQQIPNSPFLVNVVEPIDVNTIMPIGGWNSILDSEGKMFLKTNVINTIDFDTSRAGPCMMTATVESPARDVIPVTVEKTGNGAQTTLSFLPKVIGMYRIRIFCNDTALPRSPIAALASDPIDHEKVVLTGRGLQDAFVNQEAEFVIDGTESGPGEPSVKLTGVKQDIHVRLEPIASRSNMYKAMYVPVVPGAYLLSIMWANRLVRGSPFKVNVKSGANASKVNVNTDGFKQSMFGREIKAVIDTRRAGPGELTAHCMGPDKVAYCELLDHRDGTFTLNIRPQEAGKHILQVKYGGEHVPGSPFLLRVAGPPDASKVRVTGPGVEHGILANFQSRFITETRGAGAGQLTVRIRGPKGAFRVEMQRESQKDRTILCRYDPTEVGTYMIQVKWSGEHVPGSPFQIQIFDTMSELQDFQVTNPGKQLPRVVDDGHWSENL